MVSEPPNSARAITARQPALADQAGISVWPTVMAESVPQYRFIELVAAMPMENTATMIALKPPGKFARLHADLAAHGAARPFDGSLDSWAYAPLNETERAARAVLEAMAARG